MNERRLYRNWDFKSHIGEKLYRHLDKVANDIYRDCGDADELINLVVDMVCEMSREDIDSVVMQITERRNK